MCVCVSVCVYMYINIYIFISIYLYLHIYIYIYISTHTYVYTYLYIYIYIEFFLTTFDSREGKSQRLWGFERILVNSENHGPRLPFHSAQVGFKSLCVEYMEGGQDSLVRSIHLLLSKADLTGESSCPSSAAWTLLG